MLQRSLNSETGRKTRNQRNLIPKEEMDCRPQTQYVTRFVPALRLDKFSSNLSGLLWKSWQKFPKLYIMKKIENIKQLFDIDMTTFMSSVSRTSVKAVFALRKASNVCLLT